jgi:hypothetical protein
MIRFAAIAALLAACVEADERPAKWSYVHAAIIQPACTASGCHSRLTAIAGLDLSDREGAYAILVGHACGEPSPVAAPRNYVMPGSAEYSTLIHQLRGVDRNVMPPDQPLPAVEIEIVARWIDAGAQCD